MRYVAGLLIFSFVTAQALAESPVAVDQGTRPQDRRNDDLQNLNGYFPFKPVDNVHAMEAAASEIRRRILVSQGLWPLPTKSPLNAVIHGRVEREDYVVDRVFFESAPGHFVTGSLYRPKQEVGLQIVACDPFAARTLGKWSVLRCRRGPREEPG